MHGSNGTDPSQRKSIGPWRHGPILIKKAPVSPKTVPLQFQLGCELRVNATNAAMYVS